MSSERRDHPCEAGDSAVPRPPRSLLEAIIDSSEDAIISKTLDGIVTSWNRSAERIFGYTAEEMIGRPISLLAVTGLEDEFSSILEKISRGERVDHFETVRRAKNGTLVTVSLRVSPVRDDSGVVIGASKIARDITERKRADQARRTAEQQLRLIIDNVPALISYVGPDCRYRLVNRAYESWFGRRRQDVEGQLMPDIVGEAAWAVIGPKIEAAFRGEPVAYESEVAYRDGGVRWIHAAYTPDPTESGEVRGVFVLVTDITALKRAEQALREADRRKDEFLAMLAHELRNPLSAIANGVKLLRAARGDSEASSWSLEVIGRQVKHLSRMIDDLLDVSRITRGKIQLQRHCVDLVTIVRQAVEVVQPFIDSRKHQLLLTLPAEPLWVEVDPTRMEQIVANLLANAAKYTGSGGDITLAVEERADGVAIAIRDTGIGIPPDELHEMFELFAQGDRTLARSEGGLGIGLTLVKSLVELHGGSIEGRSEGVGKGSEFVVRLPVLCCATQNGLEQDGRELVGDAPCRRVLIVDDNEDTATTLGHLLELLGHEIRVTHSGPEAIDIAGTFLPDVILLDIGLPGMDGYEVARQLRQGTATRGATIIAVSGYGQKEDRTRSTAAGIDHHLVKPVEHDRLIALLRG